MKTAPLKKVAPAHAARLSLKPTDVVWQLNLDQIEAQSGRILSKVTGLASTAGTSTQSFDTGNVLYSKLRPYLNKVVCPDSPGIATTELVPLRPDPEKLDRQYLTYYLRSPEFVTWISNEVAGAKMPRVTMKVFWDHEIPLPPLAEQKRIARILDAADALRAKRREALAQLDALLQSSFLTLFGDPVTNPMGWAKVTLENLSIKVTDGDHHTPIRTKSGIKLLSARNVLNGEIDFSNTDFVGETEYARMIKRCHPQRGDVLISCSGSIGRVSRIKFDEPVVLVRSAALVKIDHAKTFPEFVEYLLRTPALQIAMQRAAKSVAQANLFQQPIKNLPVFSPPLPLQQKFACIVESVERQKAAQRAHLAELDALFASLQHRAFRGEL